jgi:hypothetical protein
MAALRKVRPMLGAGKAKEAREMALTAAILIDKRGVLEVGATAASRSPMFWTRCRSQCAHYLT